MLYPSCLPILDVSDIVDLETDISGYSVYEWIEAKVKKNLNSFDFGSKSGKIEKSLQNFMKLSKVINP